MVFCMEKLKEVEDKTTQRIDGIDQTLRRVHEFATNARDDMMAMRKGYTDEGGVIGSKKTRRNAGPTRIPVT